MTGEEIMRKKIIQIAKLEQAAENAVSALEYESLFDEALNMARDLKEIEKEVHDCALCDGREECGYSSKMLLEKLSYILFKSFGYHRQDKYDLKKTTNAKERRT